MSQSRTKFYKDKQNAKWMGVCAGIADYTGIDAVFIRVAAVLLTVAGGFPWTLIAYWMVAWLAEPKPAGLYHDEGEKKFWQQVRRSPSRTAGEVRARLREVDRRLADIEHHYTKSNQRLADEIESLR